jgi:hypothetical protein
MPQSPETNFTQSSPPNLMLKRMTLKARANRMTQKNIHEKLPSTFDAEKSDVRAEWL